MEGNGTANRSNAKGEGLREPSKAKAEMMPSPATILASLSRHRTPYGS